MHAMRPNAPRDSRQVAETLQRVKGDPTTPQQKGHLFEVKDRDQHNAHDRLRNRGRDQRVLNETPNSRRSTPATAVAPPGRCNIRRATCTLTQPTPTCIAVLGRPTRSCRGTRSASLTTPARQMASSSLPKAIEPRHRPGRGVPRLTQRSRRVGRQLPARRVRRVGRRGW